MRFLFLIFFLSFTLVTIQSQAQPSKHKEHYALLWKISGKGLQQPSYLFGTMHVLDKRAFEFSDSVLAKLQECEGFALEFSPDSVSEILTEMFMDKDSDSDRDIVGRDLKDVLTEQEYSRLNERLKKETGITLEQLKKKKPHQIAELIANTSILKNDKETFLDAYLYRIALGENKQIFGLENNRDQLHDKSEYERGIDDLREIIYEKEVQAKLQELIQTYQTGDLSMIDHIFTQRTDKAENEQLIRRNHNMVNRINELSPQHSVFYAVGCAHLPGQEGLIKLLQDKGYNVTLVPASFTGEAAKYKPKPLNTQWKTYDFGNDGYAVSLPGKPVRYAPDSSGFHLQMYPDLASGLYYLSMSIPVPPIEDKDLLKNVSKNIVNSMLKSKSDKVTNSRSFLYHDTPAMELDFFEEKDDLYGKIRIVHQKQRMYFMLVFSYQKEALKQASALRFMESLQMKKIELPPSVPQEWQTYTSSAGAYSISAPVKLKPLVKTIPSEIGDITGIFLMAETAGEDQSYWAGYYLLPAGTTVTSDSTFFHNWIENLVGETPEDKIEMQALTLNGAKGATFYKRIPGKKFAVRFLVYLRGSRMYIAFLVAPDSKIKCVEGQQFLDSFRLLPYEKAQWTTYQSDEYQLSWKVPNQVVIERDTLYNEETPYDVNYSSQDTCTGSSYSLVVNEYSPYYYHSETDFLSLAKEDYVGEEDSLLSEKSISLQGITGKEFVIRSSATQNIKRIVIYPYQQTLIEMAAFLTDEEQETHRADQFFSSLKFTDKKPTVSLYKSKAKLLLQDLQSADSSIQTAAYNMLEWYRFIPEERTLMYQALQQAYPDDTSSYESTRGMLLQRLPEVKDQHTVDFLVTIYPALHAFPYLQLSVLQSLLTLQDTSGAKAFIALIKEKIPETLDFPYNFFQPLEDSLAYNAYVYPDLFFLHRNELFRGSLYELGGMLLDSNAIPSTFFEAALPDIISYTREDVKNAEDYNSPYLNTFYAIELLQHYTSRPEVQVLLNELTRNFNDPLAYAALKVLVKHHVTVDPNVLEHFAAENSYRIPLYLLLEENHSLNLFPKKWYKQEYFAQADMYNFFGGYDDEYYYEDLKLISSKVMTYEGIPSRFYLFKALSEGVWYVGVSGPFATDKKQVYSTGDLTNSNYETLESKSVNEHFAELVK